jgi:superkiller protein 3
LAKSLYNQKTQEKYEEAEKAYRSTIKFDPKNIEAYLEIAASLFERKQYVKAEDAYRNKTILDPENSNAYLGIAECLYELKEYEKALSMYKIVLESDEIDNIGGIVIKRAIELYKNEKIDNKLIALIYLNAVLESDYGKFYGDSNLYFIMGNSYFETENYENALKAYMESVMYDDTNSTLYFLKGKSYAELEEYKKAMKAYNKAIKLKPSAQELIDINIAINKIKPCLMATIPDCRVLNKEIKNKYEILQHT